MTRLAILPLLVLVAAETYLASRCLATIGGDTDTDTGEPG
jgi:hypothetical protein